MKSSIRSLLLLSALVGVYSLTCGCVAPARYQAFSTSGVGYFEDLVGEEEYIVEFRGNVKTTSAMTKNFALYRCAELTLEKGFDHFVVLGIKDAPFFPHGPGTITTLPGYVVCIRLCHSKPSGDEGEVYDARKFINCTNLQIHS